MSSIIYHPVSHHLFTLINNMTTQPNHRSSHSSNQSLLHILLLVLLLLLVHLLLLLRQNHPIVLVIKFVPTLIEQFLEHCPHLGIHRSLIKSQVTTCTQILCKLNWITLTQNLNWCCQFLLLYSLVLVTLIVSLQSLPWQHSPQKVHTHIPNAFHVIPTCLLNTQMRIDRGIPCCSCEIFSLSVRDMFTIPLNVSFSKSKIKNEYFVASLIQPNTEVIWLNVTMNEMSVVNVLNSLNHLVDKNENRLQWEFS